MSGARSVTAIFCPPTSIPLCARENRSADRSKPLVFSTLLLLGALVCARLRAGRYVAVDRSRKMVAAAGKRNEAFVQAGMARFVESTLELLDLGDERFDTIFAMRLRLFHDQPERARQLTERWLKEEGRLFVE